MTRTTLFSIAMPLAILACIGITSIAGCGGGANADVTVSFVGESKGGGGGETTEPNEPVLTGDPGTLVGKITLDGTFAGLAPLSTGGKDPDVCGKDGPIPNEQLVVNDGGIANVFIYMDKVPKSLLGKPAPEETVVFDQKNCKFLPHAMVIRTGQNIAIWNSDGTAHNTNTKPKINTGISQTVNPGDQTGDVSFNYRKAEKEPVRVGCDFHSWMVGWHLPLDHSYAAVTGPDGTFEIKDIPPGKYRFKVFHSGSYLERRVDIEIKPGAETRLDKSYKADASGKLK